MKLLAEAMEESREQAYQDDGEVISAISHGTAERIANLIPSRPYLDKQASIAKELLGECLSSAQRTEIPQGNMSVAFRFDAERSRASEWAQKEAGLLIKEIVEEQRNVVKDYISRSMLGEFSPQEVARGLRDTIGLTMQQASWVSNFRSREIKAGLDRGLGIAEAIAAAEKPTERYHDRIHRYRTETIARTEILRANTEGRREAWQQGVEDGFIDPSWRKQWVTGQDERVCEICGELDGETASVLGDFPGGDPPAHPNCRCTLNLIPTEEAQTFDDLTDDELEALIFDLMDETIDVDVDDVTLPTDVDDDIVDIVGDDELPEWAKEAGIDDLIAQLPEDRSEIGFKMESEEDMIRRFENEHNPFSMDIEEIRAKGREADEYMELAPELEQELQRIEERFLQINVEGVPADGTPEREEYDQLIRSERDIREELREAQKAVNMRDEAEREIAAAKGLIPNFLDNMTPMRVLDIDPSTGAPGEVLRAQARVVSEVGQKVEEEALKRIPVELREAIKRGEQAALLTGRITESDLRVISAARQSVLAELRPMDKGTENFIGTDAQTAKVLNSITPRETKVTAGTSEQVRAVHEGLNAFPSSWIRTLHEEQGNALVYTSTRGFTTPDMNIVAISGEDEHRRRAVATHEVGHRMETVINGLSIMEYAYMYERNRFDTFGNVGIIPNSKNERYIMATSFAHAYTTRIYEKSTDELIGRMLRPSEKVMFEVFTTGTQAAFPQSRSDVIFGDETGEFQRWTLGVIASL